MKGMKAFGLLSVALVLVLTPLTALSVMASNCYTDKSADPPAPNKYYLGDVIHYVMNITNMDTQITNYLTLVADIRPDGSNVTLATNLTQRPGEGIVFTYNYTVQENDLRYRYVPVEGLWRYVVENFLHVTGYDQVGGKINDLKSWPSIILRPAINITKTVDFNGDSVYHKNENNDAGQTATWKIVVSNSGYDPVYNITITDTNGRHFGPFDLLNRGANKTFTYTEVIGAGKVNTATAAGVDELGNRVGPVEDYAEVTVSVPPVGGSATPVNKILLVAVWGVPLVCGATLVLLVLRRRRKA